MRRAWALAALLLGLVPAGVRADPCLLGPPPRGVWDRMEQVSDVQAMTVLVVTRFVRSQGAGNVAMTAKRWLNDVPSEAVGAEVICDRVQIETPLALDGPEGAMLTMQQGERLSADVDLADAFPEIAARLADDARIVEIPAGRYFVRQIADLDDPDWRKRLLADAAAAGEVDAARWMVGFPGALYLVPVAAEP